jgi:DNA-binding LytR/AlgR family response regulator
MEIKIKKIDGEEHEYIEIGCHSENSRVKAIVKFVKGLEGSVTGSKGEKIYEIPIVDIFYIESVDNRTFIYSSKDSYETSLKLYEFEDLLKERGFIRISKSVVVNVMKVDSIKPAFNGRFLCKLNNGEDVIISRKYVSEFREFISRRSGS